LVSTSIYVWYLVIICFLGLKGDSFFPYNLITDLGQAFIINKFRRGGGIRKEYCIKMNVGEHSIEILKYS